MPTFDQGDIVRVPFPYTDRVTRQYRPALVVSAGGLGEHRSLLWVAMITSAENRPWPDDAPLGDSGDLTGLSALSVVRPCKLATIEAAGARRLGAAPTPVMTEVLAAIHRYLGGA